MTENPDISRRVHDNYHRVENDDLVKNIFNSRKNKDGARMKIHDWMLTKAMKLTDHYKMYVAMFRVEVPTTQSQQIESTQGTHRTPSALRSPNPVTTEGESSAPHFEAQQNVAKVNEHLEDEELDHLLEGNENVNVDEFMNDIFNSQEDLDTRIEPRSDKESPKAKIDADMVIVNANEEEEESAGDEFELKRRIKGNGIEETRSLPPPPPNRSPRTHITPLYTDKETLQELTVITDDAPSSVNKDKLQELTTFMPKKNFNELSEMLYQALKEMLPCMVNREVNKIAKMIVPIYIAEGLLLERQKTQSDVAAIRIKFEKITIATACRLSATRPRDHDDYQENDAHPEGESNEFDAWMEDVGTYDDEVPDDKVSQELVEEMLEEIDEAKLQKAERKVYSTNFKEESTSCSHNHNCQRDPKAPPLTLMNQDLFHLKHGNLGPKKYTLLLHKFHAVSFPDDDMEEQTSRTKYELGHEHKFITESIVRRANGKIDPITELDYKYLNKNDIEDMYLLCINDKERVHDFQLGMERYQQKVNLTAPTITFLGIEEYNVFDITSEPIYGMIYENNKKEKRVMVHKEIHKFCDATLKRVLEGLEKYNKDVKHRYVDPSPSDANAEYL
ncbi:hypothetical protein Tco_1038117 [Tanacetum coccineum]